MLLVWLLLYMSRQGNTYVMGDIHGAHKAFIQCLERSNFDYDNDILIQLGDVADGWSEKVKY